MHEIWKQEGMKEVRQQQLCDQRRQIEEKHRLEELEMEKIKQNIEGKSTKDTEVTPAVQIVTELFTLNCLEEKAMMKYYMEIGVNSGWRAQMRHQRHRV